MVVVTNGFDLPADQNKTSYIAALCDVVPNNNRDENDFYSLLKCLEQMPKECTPFKGKILSHLRIHALENPFINIRLLASCFAKTTLLYRKTTNKSEGPVGCWKSGLTSELINLEENLNQLYGIAGLNTNNILDKSNNDGKNDDDDCLMSHEKLTESNVDFENIINEHLLKIKISAHNVCALISAQTDFDLPMPVFILLKISSKIGLIRWKDYKKKPNGLLKNHVYSLTPHLLGISLMLFKSIVTVLGSNIIPFTSFINQTLIRVLDWTRSSNLSKFYEDVYLSIRSQVFKLITFMVEQLSLNVNFEPEQLKVLLTSELVDSLEELLARPGGSAALKDEHVVDALDCLESLFISYRDLLDANLTNKCKSYVIQTCLGVYRDFSSNTIGQACRRKLLELLLTIANQPYATSTTEISYHIFELVEKFEGDPEMRSLARRSLKIGLAHRPTIVTHHEVYNCYGRPMLNADDMQVVDLPANGAEPVEDSPAGEILVVDEPVQDQPPVVDKPEANGSGGDIPVESEPIIAEPERELPMKDKQVTEESVGTNMKEDSEVKGESSSLLKEDPQEEEDQDVEVDEYMNLFVEKLA